MKDDSISRQDAIDAFDLPIYNIKGRENAERVVEYLKAVIQRIKDLPSAQPELTDEEKRLVKKLRSYHNGSYAKVIDKLLAVASAQPELTENWWKTDHGYMWLCPHCGLPVHSDFEECLRCGIKRPFAQPERKKGKWIVRMRGNRAYFICSKCNDDVDICGYGFCPNCGADMRGEQDEAD